MSEHLTSEQIARWMAGERTAGEEQHARQCPECSGELRRMEAALSLFRGSVREWSEQLSGAEQQTAWKAGRSRRGWSFPPMRWALAGVAVLMLAVIPVYHNVKEKQREVELARADAALLEQVDAEISRAVPETMEPLVKLVAWDGSTANAGDRRTKQKGGMVR